MAAGVAEVRPATDEEIQDLMGAAAGSLGPVNLPQNLTVLTDDALRFRLPPTRVRQHLSEQRQAERERLQGEYRRHGILWQRISTPENPLNALI